MAEERTEETYLSNQFGTVTSRRVVYFRKKGWFSGGSREDVPLQHITSVRVDIVRRPVIGVILALIGLIMLLSGDPGVIIVGILILAPAILFIWGSPSVVVNTAGGDLSAMKAFPWHREDAEGFSQALREQLFKK